MDLYGTFYVDFYIFFNPISSQTFNFRHRIMFQRNNNLNPDVAARRKRKKVIKDEGVNSLSQQHIIQE